MTKMSMPFYAVCAALGKRKKNIQSLDFLSASWYISFVMLFPDSVTVALQFLVLFVGVQILLGEIEADSL